mmetsp:Transcript_20252/g.32551  ORF Transcript_20252/g.32551 Transcript_20252/m.32551 type:complete len:521 (+) Transcript_20252:3086-4648(+)
MGGCCCLTVQKSNEDKDERITHHGGKSAFVAKENEEKIIRPPNRKNSTFLTRIFTRGSIQRQNENVSLETNDRKHHLSVQEKNKSTFISGSIIPPAQEIVFGKDSARAILEISPAEKTKKKHSIKIVDRHKAVRQQLSDLKQLKHEARKKTLKEIAEKVAKEETSDGFFKRRGIGISVYITHVFDGAQSNTEVLCDKWHGHIVIFDPRPEDLHYLLSPIKRRWKVSQQKSSIKVVVVHSQNLSKVYPDIRALSLCKEVYWIKNNVRDKRLFRMLKLERCRWYPSMISRHCPRAKSIQVIVCEHRVEDGENSLLLSLPEDAPAMFLAVRLSSYLEMMRNQGCRYVPIVTELSDMNTLGYLHYWPDEREFTNPLLAEGRAVPKRIAQLLLMQSQDNPYLVNVMNALMLTSSRAGHAQVYGIRIKAMATSGKDWKSVRNYFIPKKIIPVALYCVRRNKEGNEMKRYCVTNPKANMLVSNTDMVMVLSAVVPEEIMMKRQRQTFNANGSSVVHEDEAKRLANKN